MYGSEVFPAPRDLHKRYRKDLADLGLSWSPLKMYYRKFLRGPTGSQWRLSLPVLNRAEYNDESPIPVTLIVTIRSFDTEDQVYTEMVRGMDSVGWRVDNLQLRSRIRSNVNQGHEQP